MSLYKNDQFPRPSHLSGLTWLWHHAFVSNSNSARCHSSRHNQKPKRNQRLVIGSHARRHLHCIWHLEYTRIIFHIGASRTRHKCRWYCPNAAIRLADSIQLNFSLPKALYESGGALTQTNSLGVLITALNPYLVIWNL